jgi:flagellar hook-associated protein 2
MSSVSAVNSLLSGTTNTTTPTINISNLLAASSGESTPGIDVTAAVAAAIYADRAPERIWQADQTTLTGQTSALTAIQTATNAVTTDLQALNSLTGPLAARTATSSNTGEVTATAAAGTVAGNHTVVVNSLASTAGWYSDLATSATATLPASSFTLTVGSGTPVTIATGTGNPGDNLNDLATTINGDKLGVTATVVTDSTGSRLAISANTSGTAGNFSITSANYSGTSWSSQEIPTGDTLGANSFTLTVGATTTTVSTTAGETYATLASDINGMNLGVTATAGSNANGTSLSITSSTPFTISEPSFGFTQAAAGANADLTVDGVPVSSATNTVTGAISGVTLTLLGASPGTPVNLTVASDAGQVSTAVNQFVSDYNTAMGLLNAQFAVSSTANTDGTTTTAQGALATDPTVVSLQNALEQALNYTNTPAAGTTTTVASLGDLGITMNQDGTLAVNSATLNSALTANPADVQNFFEGASLNGFANSTINALNSFTDPANGAFTVDLNGFSASNTNLTSQINNFETSYVANQQTVLTAEFSKAEIALQQLPQEMQQIQAELGNNNNKQ